MAILGKKHHNLNSPTKHKLVNIAMLLLMTIGFSWYVYSNWSQFQGINISSPYLILPVLLFTALNIYSLGMLLDLTVEPHGVKLKKSEAFGLSSLTRFGNYISPGYLGAAIRAVYLKKNYQVSYAKFSSSFAVSNILQFIISGLAVLAIYGVTADYRTVSQPMIIIILAVVGFILLLFAPAKILTDFIEKHRGFLRWKAFTQLVEILRQYSKVRSYPGIVYRMFFWMTVTLGSSSAILFFLYQSLGLSVNPLTAVFIAGIGGWAIIFSITPASVGVREGLMAVGASLMGVSVPVTLTAAILLRIIVFFSVSILSVYYAPRLLNTTLISIKNISPSKE